MRFIVEDENREYEFLLSPGLYIVGRDSTCDLTLDSPRVSRRHMSCTVTENAVKVKDLGSRNCIRMNGEKVKETTLEDGDELSLGDVRLVFRGGPAVATPGEGPKGEEAPVASAEPSVEDAEQTPPEGTLMRREDVPANARVVQREGQWYVEDPESGREVQIVPAEEGEQKESLLATRKGRFLLGGLATGVLVLFLLALLFGGGQTDDDLGLSARQFDQLLGDTVEALNRGETERARELAQQMRDARPQSDAAEVLVELAGIWGEWQEDFFVHWMEVNRLLADLYRTHDSRAVSSFVRDYRDWISQELRYSEMSETARQAHRRGDHERAWQVLDDIPQGSAVRERDERLIQQVRDDLRQRLEARMETSVARQDWSEAREQAEKLIRYYPQSQEQLQDDLQKYTRYEQHAESIRIARQAIDQENYETAVNELGAVPEQSPYRSEAQRLRQRAAARGKFKEASRLYGQGEAERAGRMLDELEVTGAGALKNHIDRVLRTYEAARRAQEDRQLIEAQRHWEEIMKLETDEQNYYRRAALRVLGGMEERRRELAGELLDRARDRFREGDYEGCRQLAEQAVELDPEGEGPSEYLARLQHEGRMDYRRALNLTDRDQEEALHLFTRAMGLLSPDDKYYGWARDEKRKLERALER